MKRLLFILSLFLILCSCIEQETIFYKGTILHFKAKEETQLFNFTVGDRWEVTTELPDWVEMSPRKGLKTDTIKITVKENPFSLDRKEVIGIKFDNDKNKLGDITILQDAKID